jgi:hypothetical protein
LPLSATDERRYPHAIGGTRAAPTPAKPDGGPWYAALVYEDAAATARALGQRYLYVKEKRVYVEPVPA